MVVTFLGTGTSHGVPTLDCMIDGHTRCKKNVCRLSAIDPKHSRTRSSVYIDWDGVAILIDVSLDFRQQALREKIPRIDAVLVTHGHADHIGGMPDLRSFTLSGKPPLPLFGSPESLANLRETWGYMFDRNTFIGGGIPHIETVPVTAPFPVKEKPVVPITVKHGVLAGCYGYRLGPLVYIPDIREIEEIELQKCLGAKVLVLNCLRDEREHISHLILPQAMALARRMKPEQCYFIHMCHDIHYEIDGKGLDAWMSFSYDGLKIKI
jgi:phosphoribosyl 1,2-cyclic phosphate phosphodiesterase